MILCIKLNLSSKKISQVHIIHDLFVTTTMTILDDVKTIECM